MPITMNQSARMKRIEELLTEKNLAPYARILASSIPDTLILFINDEAERETPNELIALAIVTIMSTSVASLLPNRLSPAEVDTLADTITEVARETIKEIYAPR